MTNDCTMMKWLATLPCHNYEVMSPNKSSPLREAHRLLKTDSQPEPSSSVPKDSCVVDVCWCLSVTHNTWLWTIVQWLCMIWWNSKDSCRCPLSKLMCNKEQQTRLTAVKFTLTWVSQNQKHTTHIQLATSLSLLLSLQFLLIILLHLLWSTASLSSMYKSFIIIFSWACLFVLLCQPPE